MSNKAKGFIYIMTNEGLKQPMVKIGYATDVEARRKQLSTSGLPAEYKIYATYETQGKLEDKKLHKLIDKLNPDLRVARNREFYVMEPNDAYELLETIALISGTTDKLTKVNTKTTSNQKVRKPPINFFKCGLKKGDKLVCKADHSIVVTVENEHKVLFNNELTSLTAIMRELKGIKNIAGPNYFTHNGKSLIDIANDTQWKR